MISQFPKFELNSNYRCKTKMDEALESLMIVFLAQIDSAMGISEILAEHANEKEMTPDALITGLVYRLMTPMKEDELQEAVSKGKEMVDKIYDSDSSDEDDEEVNDTSLDPPEQDPVTRVIKRNTCNCDICIAARVCLINYSTYETQDPLSEKFHNAINHACSKHKLLIQ